MGKCCSKQVQEPRPKKQNKDIDDKRMLKVSIEVLRKDFCVQIGYNRRAKKKLLRVVVDKFQNPEEKPIVSVFSPEETNDEGTQNVS